MAGGGFYLYRTNIVQETYMAKKNQLIGKCHICGKVGPLSFEHIPPKKAFNNRRVITVKFEEAVTLGPDEFAKGSIQQRGSGDYTLCPICNHTIGHWYGKYFVDWCYQAMNILTKANGNPSLIYLNYLFPLAVLKQIIAMFFSVNPPEFAENNPELVSFVLSRDRKYLSPRYRIFIYYNICGKYRFSGVAVRFNINSRSIIKMTEFNYPPFGYMMTIDSHPPDDRLYEITHFAHYGYKEFKIMTLSPSVLPTHILLPGDYRSKKEINACYAENVAKYGITKPRIIK